MTIKKATREQIILAHRHSIPLEQAWTINLQKVRNYEKNPQVKLDKFLDKLEDKRLKITENETKDTSRNLFGGRE